ncbi:MAG: hypothetical protein KC591_13655 [Gemmatimonadetes bacterium]|nr:hypothetical protein [Gemmatimonadota bacterium]
MNRMCASGGERPMRVVASFPALVAVALLGASLLIAGGGCEPSTWTYRTSDGFTIHADLATPAGDGPWPLVVLAHDLRTDRSAWAPLVPDLVAEGWAVVAFDLRGFGQSTAEAASPAELKESDRANLSRDFLATLDAAGGIAGIDTSRVAIVAAGLSVNPAVQVASERSSVRALALIAGLITESEEMFLLEHGDLPLLLVASTSDARDPGLMRQYASRMTGRGQRYVEIDSETSWRGVDGLAAPTGLAEHLLLFLQENFPAPSESSPASTKR